MPTSRNRPRRSARQSLTCTPGPGPSPLGSVTPVHLPAPFPVLDPWDVLEVMSRSAAIPGRGVPSGSSVCLVMCDAAAEVVSVVIVHNTPADAPEAIAEVLHPALDHRADDVDGPQIGSVVVVLCRDGSAPMPDLVELRSWEVLEHRLLPLGVEVPDLLVVTPTGWTSLVESFGTGWYDGTPLSELLGMIQR